MTKRVLDVGNCGLDHGSIKQLITTQFDAVVDQADRGSDAQTLLASNDYALVVVNRLLDVDGSAGMDVVRDIRAKHANVPIMLITNFAEHQQAAVDVGCVPGFGKRELSSNTTVELLREHLG